MFPEGLDLKTINAVSAVNMVAHLGIEFTEIGKDYVKAKMPVDEKTKQPFGMLHGGASVVLAETLGSVASNVVLAGNQYAVGLEINANHIKGVKDGYVHGTAKPIHLGRKTHVWSIEIKDDNDNLVCVSRLTVAVIEKSKE